MWALFSSVLFFDGCEQPGLRFTIGTPPFAQVTYQEGAWWESFRVDEFWPTSLAIHLVLLVVVTTFFTYSRHWLSKKVAEKLLSNTTLFAFCMTAMCFNSFCYLPSVWLYVVIAPLNWIAPPPDESSLSLATVSRVQYFLSLLAVAGLSSLFLRLARLGRRKERWWQVSMGAVLVTMLVGGTIIGILGRLILAS